jgi:porin
LQRIKAMKNKVTARLIALAVLASCGSARAGAPIPFPNDIAVDWDGLRSELRDLGLDIRFGYTNETASNLQGGDNVGVTYDDQLTFSFKFDLEKLLNLNQAQFQMTFTDRNGNNLSSVEDLKSLQQVQEIYGRGQTWLITQFWYEQKYFDGKLDWKAGRLTDGEDFAAFSCDFMNLTFCGAPPGNLVGNYWYNWPISQWGTRLKLNIANFGYVQVGAYEVNPNFLSQHYAFDFGNPPSAIGALLPVEIGWLPTFGGRLDGSYKFGAWYNTSKSSDVFENTAGLPLVLDGGTPLERHGAYGEYINFLQRVTGSAGEATGVSVFLNATLADRRTSVLDKQVTMGLFDTGVFASRPKDKLGVAIGGTHVNSRVAAAERLQDDVGLGQVQIQASEYVTEIFYGALVAPWLELRPNVQYVRHPGGSAENTDDVILGLKLSANF